MVSGENELLDNAEISLSIMTSDGSVKLKISDRFLSEREREMEATASQYCIDPSSWNGSRVFKAVSTDRLREVVVFPERDSVSQNFTQRLSWKRWLTDLLDEYFKTGKLVIPDECQGYDLLVTLEYFGILYQPQQLEFSSYATYVRVKHWSEYFTHRVALGEWVADRIVDEYNKSNSVIFFATANRIDERLDLDRFDSDPVVPLAPECRPSDGTHVSCASTGAIFNFFNREVGEGDPTAETASLMRKDFALYIQQLLPDVKTSFSLTLMKSGKERAVLRVDVVVQPRGQTSTAEEVLSLLKEARTQLNPDAQYNPNTSNTTKQQEHPTSDLLIAPFHIVRTRSGHSLSETSAITIPFSLEGDQPEAIHPMPAITENSGKVEEANAAIALDFQRSITGGIDVLQETMPNVFKNFDKDTGTTAPKRFTGILESIEWFSGLGLCNYPSSVLQHIGEETTCGPLSAGHKDNPSSLKEGPTNTGFKYQDIPVNTEARDTSLKTTDPFPRDPVPSHEERRSIFSSEDNRPVLVGNGHDYREEDTGYEIPHTKPKKLASVSRVSLCDPNTTVETLSESSKNSTELKSPTTSAKKNETKTLSTEQLSEARQPEKKIRKCKRRGGLISMFRRRRAEI